MVWFGVSCGRAGGSVAFFAASGLVGESGNEGLAEPGRWGGRTARRIADRRGNGDLGCFWSFGVPFDVSACACGQVRKGVSSVDEAYEAGGGSWVGREDKA